MSLAESQARAANIATIKWSGIGLAFIGGVAVFVAYVAKDQMAVLAAAIALFSLAALLALIVWTPNAFVLTQVRNWNGPIANFALLVPLGLMLGLGAGYHLVRWEGLELAAAVAAALSVVGMIWAPRPEATLAPTSHIILALLFGAGLGWSGASLINCLFDKSPGQTYQATVEGKYRTYGKGGHYHLTLAPFGPVSSPGTVDVGYSDWSAASEGSSICVRMRPGLLGFAWWKVGC
jgi:hypothetical protein